ncbi:MAG TPA: nucleoside hydrolase [Pseudonocardiaceae bacterium]|nr:nucleoside hydrolase [Pseudonocardiaceae bacterium]
MARGLLSVLLVVALAAAGTGSAIGTASAQEAVTASGPTPVIYDGDMDVDDTSTLAYLCQADKDGRIDLLAVTIDDNGFGTPGRALTHAHTVLNDCGLPWVPVADGSDTIVHQAPQDAMQTVETVLTGALGDGSATTPPSSVTAPELIESAAASSPRKVTILTTGPQSNLAAALGDAGSLGGNWLADRIRGLYVMGGAIDVPGNLFGSALTGFDNSQELNMWLDPAAARTVFDTMRPGVTHLIPLDATNSVPITPAFIAKLDADQHTESARLVDSIMTQPDMTAGIDLGIYYWWDALAALSAFQNQAGITQFNDETVDVVQDGVQSGRTEPTPTGAPVGVALSANQALFEQTFLDALNGR